MQLSKFPNVGLHKHTQKVAPSTHTPRWLPLPNQFLLHGYNEVFLKFIDVRFDQLLGKRVWSQPPTFGQEDLGPEDLWVCSNGALSPTECQQSVG